MDIAARFDELFLKGSNQGFFIKKIKTNLEQLFPGLAVERSEGGLLLHNFSEDPEELKRLALVPGIAKISPCLIIDNNFEKIIAQVLNIEYDKNIKTFRVSASRSYKKYAKSSREINQELGGVLMDKYGWQVDLINPDLNIFVDIHKDRALIRLTSIDGAGGLPTGTSGKALVLLSGGIDSPVAAYMLMKRGAEISLVHFQNQTAVSEQVSEKIFDLAKTLARYQPKVKLFIVPFAEYQRELVKKIPAAYRMIASRRQMFRLSEKIARREKIFALGTGDSLGQVASQTMENMRVVYAGGECLVLLPLVGYNKSEIIKAARNIGTLRISERPYEDCCSLFVAKHPETKARLSDVEKMEKHLDFSTFDKPRFISYNISIT